VKLRRLARSRLEIIPVSLMGHGAQRLRLKKK